MLESTEVRSGMLATAGCSAEGVWFTATKSAPQPIMCAVRCLPGQELRATRNGYCTLNLL
eukprot:20444-Eustigmatos_ZCMA.PRE.1